MQRVLFGVYQMRKRCKVLVEWFYLLGPDLLLHHLTPFSRWCSSLGVPGDDATWKWQVRQRMPVQSLSAPPCIELEWLRDINFCLLVLQL